MNEKAETIRKKYRYRRLILTGKLSIARQAAVRMIGPDTAYHLYSSKPSRIPKKKKPRQ
jgi:hypothetical protein